MANWTPEGAVGQMFGLMSSHMLRAPHHPRPRHKDDEAPWAGEAEHLLVLGRKPEA